MVNMKAMSAYNRSARNRRKVRTRLEAHSADFSFHARELEPIPEPLNLNKWWWAIAILLFLTWISIILNIPMVQTKVFGSSLVNVNTVPVPTTPIMPDFKASVFAADIREGMRQGVIEGVRDGVVEGIQTVLDYETLYKRSIENDNTKLKLIRSMPYQDKLNLLAAGVTNMTNLTTPLEWAASALFEANWQIEDTYKELVHTVRLPKIPFEAVNELQQYRGSAYQSFKAVDAFVRSLEDFKPWLQSQLLAAQATILSHESPGLTKSMRGWLCVKAYPYLAVTCDVPKHEARRQVLVKLMKNTDKHLQTMMDQGRRADSTLHGTTQALLSVIRYHWFSNDPVMGASTIEKGRPSTWYHGMATKAGSNIQVAQGALKSMYGALRETRIATQDDMALISDMKLVVESLDQHLADDLYGMKLKRWNPDAPLKNFLQAYEPPFKLAECQEVPVCVNLEKVAKFQWRPLIIAGKTAPKLNFTAEFVANSSQSISEEEARTRPVLIATRITNTSPS